MRTIAFILRELLLIRFESMLLRRKIWDSWAYLSKHRAGIRHRRIYGRVENLPKRALESIWDQKSIENLSVFCGLER